jgi:uncharacterized protein (UPF0128 family)
VEEVKHIKLNPYLKNLFFEGFKSGEQYQEVERRLGKNADVSIIIQDGKAILRASKAEKKQDIPFTDGEYKTLLKKFRVKEETVKECKSIFLLIDFEAQNIHIQKNKLDGTKQNFIL